MIKERVYIMPEKKTDRRTLKTRKAICEAFAELLAEKELRKVTVQEIADKADVNRVTFYKHYLDVYDLYDKVEQDVLVEMGLLMLSLEEIPTDKFFSDLLDYVDDNRSIFKLVFCENCPGQLRRKFSTLIERLFRKMSAEMTDSDLNDKSLEYKNCYRSQGCIAVIERWVNSGFEVEKGMIAKTLSELDMNTEQVL